MQGDHGAQKALQLGMLDGFGGEVVLHDDGGEEGDEVYLVHLLIYARFRLEHHASLVAGPQLRNVPEALCVSLSEGYCHASAQSLKDLIAGNGRTWSEAGGQVWGEAGQPGSHEDALQATLGIDEALGSVYECGPRG